MARMLVFAEDADFAEVLALCLRAEGHEAEFEADRTRARSMHEGGEYDLVVIDVTPPERVGLALVEELRGRGPAVKVILAVWREDELKAGRRSPTAILRKPFGCSELLAALCSASV